MAGKSWRQEREEQVVLHPQLGGREHSRLALLPLLILIQSGTPAHGMAPPTVNVDLPSSINPLKIPSETLPEVCLPGDCKSRLTVKVKHQSHCSCASVSPLVPRVLNTSHFRQWLLIWPCMNLWLVQTHLLLCQLLPHNSTAT